MEQRKPFRNQEGNILTVLTVAFSILGILAFGFRQRFQQTSEFIRRQAGAANDIAVRNYVQSRHHCIFQVYNLDSSPGDQSQWSCTKGTVVKLYGEPGIVAHGTTYGRVIVNTPKTTLTQLKREVRAKCIDIRRYRLETREIGAKGKWRHAGDINCEAKG